MGWNALGSMASAAKFLLLVVVLCLSSTLVSFLVVYQLGKSTWETSAVDPVVLQRARILRTFANELTELCNAYSRRVPEEAGAPDPLHRRWVDREFRREVQFLEQRMNDTILEDEAVYTQLKATTARCGAMARNPGDKLLRAQTLREAARTVTAVEAYIGRVTNNASLGVPRVRVTFEGAPPGPGNGRSPVLPR